MSIRLIVGLGNPGPQYAKTRHNAGAWFLEYLTHELSVSLSPNKKFKAQTGTFALAGKEYQLLLPETFMNLSGESVQAFAHFYKIPTDAILVVHDELDLPTGIARLKKDGGHGGHNGLRSMIQHLNSNDFWRLRIGIGHPGQAHLVTDFVLNRPNTEEKKAIDQSIADAFNVLPDILKGDTAAAMQTLHTPEEK